MDDQRSRQWKPNFDRVPDTLARSSATGRTTCVAARLPILIPNRGPSRARHHQIRLRAGSAERVVFITRTGQAEEQRGVAIVHLRWAAQCMATHLWPAAGSFCTEKTWLFSSPPA